MARVVLIRGSIGLVAAASLMFGAWRSAPPDALLDFQRVTEWTAHLVRGGSPYGGDSEADYPPWALLPLAPLLLVPTALQSSTWIAINLMMALGVCFMLVRWADEPPPERRGLFALLLAGACFRVLSQFSLLSFTCAVAGARHKSAIIGGLWLGLSLMKPQIGGALVLAHALMGDWRRAAVAAAVPVVLTLIASALIGVSPLTLVGAYWDVLESVHGGSRVFAGHTELEAWLAPFSPQLTTVFGSLVVGAVLLTPALVAAWRRHGSWASESRLELYALCGVISLLATRHLSYDFLLLLPLVVAWRSAPFATRVMPQPWKAAWVVTAALLVLQIPGWWRRAFVPMGLPEVFDVILHLDRILCIALFGLLSWRLIRLNVTK